MRLIDADVLKADYGMADCKDCKTEWKSCQYDRFYSKMDFCGWLDDAETVDAVPVVRCKDCKWWRDTDHTCKEHSIVSPMGANEYCSRGERKERDGNG